MLLHNSAPLADRLLCDIGTGNRWGKGHFDAATLDLVFALRHGDGACEYFNFKGLCVFFFSVQIISKIIFHTDGEYHAKPPCHGWIEVDFSELSLCKQVSRHNDINNSGSQARDLCLSTPSVGSQTRRRL